MIPFQASDEKKSREQLLQEVAECRSQLALKEKEVAALKFGKPEKKESRFLSLFESMPEGFALHEILLDSTGKPYDYRFLELNPAFERFTGLKKEAVVGKTVREVIPTIETYLIEAFGRVALEGKPIRIENYLTSLNNWYEIFAYCTAPGQFAALFSNITERKRSKESLEEAGRALERERNVLQSMIDSAKNLHLVYLDPDFNFVRVNHAYAKTCGYTPDKMIGKHHFTLYPHKENEAIFAGVRDSGISVMFHDKPFIFPDQPDRGVTYWDWTLESIKDSSGRIEGLVFSLFETTERKQAEQALQESEIRYHRLFENDLTGNFVCTSDGEILLCNQAFVNLFGFSSYEEAVGSNMSALYIDPAERESILELLKRSGKLEKYSTWRKRCDGDQIHIVENLVGHFNDQGELYEIQGYIFDDTERKRAEAALRLNEVRFRTFVEASSEVLYRMNSDWREMRQLQGGGFLADTERPNPDWLQQYIYPDDQPRVIAAIDEAIRTKSPFVFEHRVRRADGTLGWTISRAVPLLDEYGDIIEWFGAANDVTERKQAEEAIKSSLAEKEVMLKEIHHRVKNNMQVISSLVQLQAAEIEDPVMRDIFQDVVYRVRSMAMVHEKLYQSSDLARVDFADYAQSLLGYLWRAQGSTASGIKLNLELKPVLLSVNTAIPCGLILNELVSNALKHAFVGRDSGKVTVALHGEGQACVRLSVHDDGIGLPQGLNWKKADSLGLRLVQMLVGQLQAEVDVISEKGTVFTIIFEKQKG